MKFFYIILFCIVLFFTIYFYNSSKFNYGEVERVLDGDTIELINGEKIRLYGINTPEIDEYYYVEAMDFLEEKIKYKKIKYKDFGKDQYNRTLATIYLEDVDINKELVRKGYATPYFTYKDDLENVYEKAFEECIKENIGLCKKSLDVCASCINLKELNYDAKGDDRSNVNGEYFILENNCDFDCNLNDWLVKDDTSRNRFKLKNIILKGNNEMYFHSGSGINTKEAYFLCTSKKCSPIWNNDFDSFYLRSHDGGLIIYFNYYSS
jgi:hypothetical protein